MNPSRAPEKGEVLKLGPPASGEVIIAVDPGSTGATFAAGTETLLPGAEIPVHKHLDQDEVLFVHKGQARATLNERIIIVVPGAMLHVPRGAWHGLRNTGTGALQIAWASAPPGVEAFFRDLSRRGASPAASGQALQELAQRHRIEFRQATDAPVPVGRRHRGRRGGRRDRGGRGPARPGSSGSAVIPSSAHVEPSSATPVAPGVSPAPSTVPDAPAASSAPHRHRRRRRGGGRQPSGWRHSLAGKDSPGSVGLTLRVSALPSPTPPTVGVPGSVAGRRSTPPAAPQGRREQLGGIPAVSAPSPAQGPSRPGAGGQRPPRGRHRRRVREVYMGGRWVRVEGEGPVIAPGPQGPDRRGPKRGEDDEPPATPLSVPL